MRDRLRDIIARIVTSADDTRTFEDIIADELIANGVIVPPCKVGDMVYHFSRDLGAVFPYFVENLNISSMGKNETYWSYEANFHDEETDELIDGIDFDLDDIGKTIFLTREEAEKALEERNNNDTD